MQARQQCRLNCINFYGVHSIKLLEHYASMWFCCFAIRGDDELSKSCYTISSELRRSALLDGFFLLMPMMISSVQLSYRKLPTPPYDFINILYINHVTTQITQKSYLTPSVETVLRHHYLALLFIKIFCRSFTSPCFATFNFAAASISTMQYAAMKGYS